MIKWYNWIVFAVVVLIALAMSWYSMTDLVVNGFHLPVLLAVCVSLAFDGGAIWLGSMAIEYAKTEDSGVWAEFWTFVFVLASIYINVQHAVMNDYGHVGMVMFGAAPIIAGVLLKVSLSFITRQQRRASGRLVDRLPVVGWLTWLRYSRQSWRLMSVAMQKRLVDAADKLVLPEDRHGILSVKAEVQQDIIDIPEISVTKTEVQSLESVQDMSNSQDLMSRTEQDIDDLVYVGEIVTLPDWLPREPTMSIARIAEICVENGQMDTNTILQWTKDIKHSDVKYGSVYKAVQRARQKV